MTADAGGYHFLIVDPVAQQASNTLAHVGDPVPPGMVDRASGSFSPTLARALAYIDAARAAPAQKLARRRGGGRCARKGGAGKGSAGKAARKVAR
jgi:hypothetical protein